MSLHVEPSERAWEMVSQLRGKCCFQGELAMEVYAGVVGDEAAMMFLRWLADHHHRPLSADDILNSFDECREQAAQQRDDLQTATISDLVATVRLLTVLSQKQEENLVAYSAVLSRDLRFGFVKSLLKIPLTAAALSQDKYDAEILDAIRTISSEAS